MLEKVTERVKKVSVAVFTSGSRAGTPQENGILTPPHSYENLLIVIIILVIVVIALIFIIIYGYCKYVRGKEREMENEGRERTSNMREATGGFEQPSSLGVPPEVPNKMRKRSMTFSETDEECRKYRENLADLSDTQEDTVQKDKCSRKKSAVTFVGVKEIDANES